jgi:hypothetical protein
MDGHGLDPQDLDLSVRTLRDVGVADTPQEAVRAALKGLGEPYASEMAAGLTG